MDREVKLSKLTPLLETLDYPVSKHRAASEFDDVTLLLADGEENLGDALRGCNSEGFEDPASLESELYGFLPVEAIGEPGQSEGDA